MRCTNIRRFRPFVETLEDRTLPSTFTVLNTHDSGAGSLRNDIAQSKAGDTILFSPHLTGRTILLQSSLAVTHNLSIRGPGATRLTVEGGAASFSVFTISQGSTVSLSKLTVSNGNASGDGGGINNDGKLTLTDCILWGNSAADGGGISNGADGNLTINFSQITGNSSNSGNGGGIVNSGILSIANTIVNANTASSGGGIANLSSGQLTVSTCTFTHNEATGVNNSDALGGALYVQGSGGTGVSITATTFDSNSANATTSGNDVALNTMSVGGIYVGGGTFLLAASTISNNQSSSTPTATSDGSNDADATAVAIGGLSIGGGTVNVLNSTFDGNHGSASASAIANGSGNAQATSNANGNIYVSAGTVKLLNATVVGGQVAASGSAQPNTGQGTVATFGEENLQIAGGTVSVQDTILQTVFGNFTDLGNNLTNMDFGSLGLGPLQNNGGPTLTLALLPWSPAIDAGNNAAGAGPTDQRGFSRISNGKIDIGAYEYQVPAVHKTLIVNNTLDSGTGSLRLAIADSRPGDTVAFAPSLAGKTIQLNSQLEIDHSLTITGLGATRLTVRRGSTSQFTIFLVDRGVHVNLNGLTISNGAVAVDGGAISNDGTLALADCVLEGNTAGNDGGAVSNGPDGNLTIVGSTFVLNTTGHDGGAIVNSGILTVTNSVFTANTAIDGGGIDNFNTGQLTITACTFTKNQATAANNSNALGGALYVQGSSGSGVSITASTFDSNTAAANSTATDTDLNTLSVGAIYVAGGTFSLTSSTVSNNHASANANATSDDSTNANATAVAVGGLDIDGGTGNILNSTFDGNRGSGTASATSNGTGAANASGSGVGDIYVAAGTLGLLNATVVNGKADASAAAQGLHGNSANSSAEKNLQVGGGAASVQNTILQSVQGSFTDLGNNLTNMDLNALGLGPLQDNGGPTETRALLPGSPAIDAGSNTAAAGLTDQRGFNRVVNGTIDIGAYEYQPPQTKTTLTASPNPSKRGAPVTFAVHVQGMAPGSNIPAGTVTLMVDGRAIATTALDSNGKAVFRIATLSAGKHTVEAVYNGVTIGDYVLDPSTSSPLTQTVLKGRDGQ